jgi:hypothetical protein
MESVDHLFVNCRFTFRLWGLVEDGLGLHFIDLHAWPTLFIHSWWDIMAKRKDLASLTLVVSWEIWNERNTWVFKNKQAPPPFILENDKRESKL